MFSSSYFKYLLKSKKYLLIVIFAAYLVGGFFLKTDNAIEFIFWISIIVCFFVPFDTFSYIHNKKAVDTYFSLPIERKQLLNTGLLYDALVIVVPYILASAVALIKSGSFLMNVFALMLVTALMFIAVSIINSLFNIIGNNLFDSVVITGAYTFLPLALYLIVQTFISTYVAGNSANIADYYNYLSPLYLAITAFNDCFRVNLPKIVIYSSTIVQMFIAIGYGIVSYILLNRNFVNRKVERASTASGGVFGYPLIINLYLFVTVFSIIATFSYSYISFKYFLIDNIAVLIIIFIIYVAAHFVYKRKFYFDVKMPIIYILCFALSLGICAGARNTKGYHISEHYPSEIKNGAHIYFGAYENNESLLKWLEEKSIYTEYLEADISIGYISDDQLNLKKETKTIIENIRKEYIEQFYSNYVDNRRYYNGTLDVDDYHYNGYHEFTPNELLTLASDENVTVYIYTDEGTLILDKNGEFLIQDLVSYYPKQ